MTRLRLRDLRELRGMTQEQLAEKANISVSQISRIETGDRSFSAASLIDLAAALGVKPGELFDEPRAESDGARLASLENRVTNLDKSIALVHERLDAMQRQIDNIIEGMKRKDR